MDTAKIRVGVVGYQFGNLSRGGAEVQLEKTVKYLQRRGEVEIEMIGYETRNIERFDLIHFFKSQVEYAALIDVLRQKKIPYVLSTVYYPHKVTYEILRFLYLRKVLPAKVYDQLYFAHLFRLWSNAAYLFPNTDDEAAFLRKIGVRNNMEIIHNGLDREEMTPATATLFFEHFPYLKDIDFVLNVGRIDRRKNQKKLVEACILLKKPVVLIGEIADVDYFNEIKSLGYSQLYHLGPIFDRQLLFSAYNACEVFCLPSTLETPGLVALEAAYYHKPIVITDKGGTRYYFGDDVYYVNWRDTNDIKNKLEMAITEGKTIKEVKLFWDVIVNKYIEIYQQITLKKNA